jgi:hypothetical protein
MHHNQIPLELSPGKTAGAFTPMDSSSSGARLPYSNG